jgi:hypothetical protein
MTLGLGRLVLTGIGVAMLVGTFRQLGKVPAEGKTAVLEAGIAAAMVFVRFGLWLEIPLLLGAWWADSALRQRFARALPAPDGARCAAHPDVVSLLVCARCGSFMCSACGADGRQCVACLARMG